MLEQRPFRIKARQTWNEKRWREHRWAYARLTEIVDAQIGSLLNAMYESGLLDKTLVVFTSDHGDMDAAHRMEHKSTLYEEACHIPLMVRPPGGVCGRVASRLASNGLDLLPTFCDYAGVEPPDGLLGRSLRPIIDGSDHASWRSSLPIECATGRALVTDAYKYAVYDMGSSNEQLYDLQNDPFEQRNALHDARQQQIVAALRAEFAQVFSAEKRELVDVRDDAAKG
jgi:choline-sulfatase